MRCGGVCSVHTRNDVIGSAKNAKPLHSPRITGFPSQVRFPLQRIFQQLHKLRNSALPSNVSRNPDPLAKEVEMDPLSAGASVVTFVGLGLASAKTVYEILSSVKAGNAVVERVARDVQGLAVTLERVKKCPVSDQTDRLTLGLKIKACADDMKACADELEKLATNTPELTVARQWRKVKIFLKEKDVERIGHVVARHTSALNLYLDLIASDALHHIALNQQVIRETQASMVVQQITMAAQQAAMTTTLQNAMAQLTMEAGSMLQMVQATASGIGIQENTVAHKLTEVLEEYRALLLSLPDSNNEKAVRQGVRNGDALANANAEDIPCATELVAIIESILDAIRDKTGLFLVQQAADVTKPFLQLLQIIASEQVQESNILLRPAFKRWCESRKGRDLAELRQNLIEAQGQLMSSRKIALNTSGKTEDFVCQPPPT
ncbi:hypothetical protein B0T21DRAFT_366631 [Apiosordaria backusii]|uniref:Azaphilone pigments biosynthesis cluster protein L N-terminal domain-containing protein n=1 Tax=Apiosordaria backusii TaxID=314023 RepID=A0AA40EFB0_9PEZI|nr:hypothetical protein B0T21DRAFT_366631 [Apiosordaria backusii]